MCEQCVAKAELIKADVLPGFSLMKAEAGSPNWPQGWYGLVECNDPLLVFPQLATDPIFGWSDAKLDTLDALPEPAGTLEYLSAVESFREHYQMPPAAGYTLVKACMAAGYSEDLHGHIECWLVHHLASALQPGLENEPQDASPGV